MVPKHNLLLMASYNRTTVYWPVKSGFRKGHGSAWLRTETQRCRWKRSPLYLQKPLVQSCKDSNWTRLILNRLNKRNWIRNTTILVGGKLRTSILSCPSLSLESWKFQWPKDPWVGGRFASRQKVLPSVPAAATLCHRKCKLRSTLSSPSIST